MTISALISFAPQGLRQQLILRFVMICVLVGVLGAWGAWVIFTQVIHQSRQAHIAESRDNITEDFQKTRYAWGEDAEKLKTQIDFMHILQQPGDKRWLELQAYLRALEGGVKNYDTMLIVRADGSLAFSFGPLKQEIAGQLEHIKRYDWLPSKDGNQLRWVMRLPIWMGAEGKATMYLLRPVENSTLNEMHLPGTEVMLAVNGKVIAQSDGSMAFAGGAQASTWLGRALADSAEYKAAQVLSANDAAVVQLQFVERGGNVIAPVRVVLFITLQMVVIFLALWLVLGMWIKRVSQRIAAMSEAGQQFIQGHTLDVHVAQLLSSVMQPQDEVAQVANTAMQMMRSVEQYVEESLAYIQTLDMLEEAVIEVDREGNLMRASAGWARLTGRDEAGNVFAFLHADDKDLLVKQLGVIFRREKVQTRGRVRLLLDAQEIWIEYRLIASPSASGTIQSVRGVIRDVTQNYQQELRITQMALHDALTGLPNRILLEDRAEQAISNAARLGNKVAIGFIDLDHFKNINDAFGHKVGDQLLIGLSKVLGGVLRPGDTLARWGGDEFVVLLPDLSDVDDARQAAKKMIEVCTKPALLDEQAFNYSFSMGFAVYPDDAESLEIMLSQADRAMFYAKDQGRNNAQFFSDMAGKGFGKREVYIQNRLATAINSKQILTWFQPLVDAKSRQIIGVEALARWEDAEYGWISPVTFIPMAENMGLIMDLSQQVWEEALSQGKRWREMGYELKIAINISRRQLFAPSFIQLLLDATSKYQLPAAVIILEVTESIANIDTEQTGRRLKELADLGFTLSIDDFGTGYSSLSQLHNMPIGEVKIDISFVRRALEAQGGELIQAIQHMAEAFSLHSVAEGVEDEATARLLQDYGVDYLQGYLFGKPMKAEEIDILLLSTNVSHRSKP